MGLLGAASTAAANELAHTITFAVNLAIFSNMCQFIYRSCKSKLNHHRSHFSNWAAMYCIVLATVLVMVDLLRHVLQDSKTFYLSSPTGDRFGINTESCTYTVQHIVGDSCPDRGIGPVTISQIAAVNMDGWSMYKADGSLSNVGWFITVGCTWSGMILMSISILLSMRKSRTATTEPLLR